jgi:hypothetical protein
MNCYKIECGREKGEGGEGVRQGVRTKKDYIQYKKPIKNV